jgi:hypothetical protein
MAKQASEKWFSSEQALTREVYHRKQPAGILSGHKPVELAGANCLRKTCARWDCYPRSTIKLPPLLFLTILTGSIMRFGIKKLWQFLIGITAVNI